MPRGTMNLAPLLYIGRATKRPLLFLICALPLTITMMIAISTIGHVDLLIALLLFRRPLAT
jgi:hypothetical protein